MKKIFSILTIVLIVFIAGYQMIATAKNNKEVSNMTDKKILIAYYSYSGNTKELAEKIQKQTGGDLFEIKTVKPYPKAYSEVVKQAKREKAENYKPAITEKVSDIDSYDVVFIGTPVWWYTMAPPVKTFLAENNLAGKVIVPFCTHGGGGASSTFTDIQKIVSNSTVTSGFVAYEKSAAPDEISSWLKQIKF